MRLTTRAEGSCGPNETDHLGLRVSCPPNRDNADSQVGSIFVILVTSLVGTLFPVITKRTRRLRKAVPGAVFEFGKFFGSGVILATALIHLLEPAVDSIGEGNTLSAGGCIPDGWAEYPYPVGLSPGTAPKSRLRRLTPVRSLPRIAVLYLCRRALRAAAGQGAHFTPAGRLSSRRTSHARRPLRQSGR